MKKFQLPFGVQDFMPSECYNKIAVEQKLAAVFAAHGFLRVSLPAIEFFDAYDRVLDRSAVKKTFKTTDSDGSLLMLRFDPTLQICRMAESKLEPELINKVYYLENSYEYISDETTARSREFPQAGVEMLGNSGSAGDMEIVVTAIESLLAAGLGDFMLELGQVDYFNGIAMESGLSDSDAGELRALINKKDMLGVEMFLRDKNVNEKFVAQFLKLPSLFGDCEVFERARAGVCNERSLNAIDGLETVVNALKAAGLDKYVSVDLGLLRGEYYTGMVMKGFSTEFGMPILDGGRYDGLCSSFGSPMPAVGFCIGVKRLLIALEKELKLTTPKFIDCAYISDGKSFKKEYEYVSKLRSKGFALEKLFADGENALEEYCETKGIENAFAITGNTVKYVRGKEPCDK